MKKILMMAFVSVAVMAFSSCSKDNDDEQVSLVGTHWVGTETYSVPILGSVAITADLTFTTETTCIANISLTPTIPNVDLPQGEFEYTFDGKKVVVIKTNSSLVGDLTLEYQGNTMVFNLPASIAQMAGGATSFVLNKR
jgi:hypothetical protein